MASKREPRILCVDDEESILNSLRRVFMDEPWEVALAASADEALRILGEQEFDIVLSDFRMPGTNGVELLKRVRELHPHSIRMILSGYVDLGVVVSALHEGGIHRFLTKPWNDEELVHTVRKAIEHYELGAENRRLDSQLRRANLALKQSVDESHRELADKAALLDALVAVLERSHAPVVAVRRGPVVLFANPAARSRLAGIEDDPAEMLEALRPGLVHELEECDEEPRILDAQPEEGGPVTIAVVPNAQLVPTGPERNEP